MWTQQLIRIAVIGVLVLSASINAFVIPSAATHRINRSWQLSGLMDAFKNDETLGKPVNAGLTNGPKYNDQVTVNGIAAKNAVVGQKLTVVAGGVRVKIPVNCQKGDCGTCMVKLNGRKVKACQVTLPAGKVTITTL
jgi:ferredoxin